MRLPACYGKDGGEILAQWDGGQWETKIAWFLCSVILLHFTLVLILASVPPISRDALIHHLAVPKMYLQHGGIYEIPFMHFSYFPMNLDLLYLIPLAFKNDIAAKYIHFIFALLTAGLIYQYLKESLNRTYGLIGALFFLTIPIIVKLSVTVYVDLGLIFFSWACLYYFLKWHDSGFSPRHLVLAASFCGLALGTKYNGLILLLIMAALVSLSYSARMNHKLKDESRRERYSNSVKGVVWGIVFVMIALILFSPWMIRNFAWKKNPIYPLYNGFFNPAPINDKVSPQKEQSEPINAFWMRKHIYKESLMKTLTIPIRMFFQGQDDNPQYFDGKLNPFLLIFAIASFLSLKGNFSDKLSFHKVMLALFAVLYSLFVLFQADFRIRYMAPAIPPLVVLSIFGIHNIINFFSTTKVLDRRLWWGGGIIVGIVMFGMNAIYIQNQFDYIQPLKFLSGKVDRDRYISHFRIEYPVIHYANKILPDDARVLCLSIGDRTYYLERSAHLSEDFYDRVDGAFTEKLLLQRLHRYQTTHIIIDTNVFFAWLRTLNAEERKVFQTVFQDHTDLLYEKDGIRLLFLK